MSPTNIISRIGSAAELHARLLGRWQSCDVAVRFGPPDVSGLEFTDDGHWYFLESRTGELERGSGFGDYGTFEIIDTSLMNGPGAFQVNLELNSGGTYILQWSLSESPRLLMLDSMGSRALYSHLPDSSGACSEP
jgi:hypothetical protein